LLGIVTCMECDLVIDHETFDFDNTIAYQMLRQSMQSHSKNTGHTLLKLVITLNDQDMEGVLDHD